MISDVNWLVSTKTMIYSIPMHLGSQYCHRKLLKCATFSEMLPLSHTHTKEKEREGGEREREVERERE